MKWSRCRHVGCDGSRCSRDAGWRIRDSLRRGHRPLQGATHEVATIARLPPLGRRADRRSRSLLPQAACRGYRSIKDLSGLGAGSLSRKQANARGMADTTVKQVEGRFEATENVLHLWFPRVVRLTDAESVKAFFDEVVTDWIDPTPGRFYLLVNYQNLHIAAQAADDYAQSIRRFQHRLLGTFRYGVPADFTGVAVSLGNMRLKARANLFDDEAAARAAIAHSKQGEGKGGSGRG